MKIKTIKTPEVTREQRADEGKLVKGKMLSSTKSVGANSNKGKIAKSLTSGSESSNCAAISRIKLRPRELISTSKVVLTPESKPSEVLIYAAQTPAYKEAMVQGMCLVVSRLRAAELITVEQQEETLKCIQEKLEQIGRFTGYVPGYLATSLAAYELAKKGYKGQKLMEEMHLYYENSANAVRIKFQTSGRGTKYYLRFAYRLRAAEKLSERKTA